MAKVADRPLADGNIEDGEILFLEVRCTDNRVVGVDVCLDLSDLLTAVTERVKCEWNGAVDNCH